MLKSTFANCLSRGKRLFTREVEGQELIEYALIVGFIAVVIGAMLPGRVLPSMTAIYIKINELLVRFGGLS